MSNRNKRRENYIYKGLMYPNRPKQHPGRRAAQFEPAPDTVAREAIITPYLAQRHTYRETAHELILHGFTPPRALDLRAFLLDFCDAYLKALSPSTRKRGGEHLDPPATSGDSRDLSPAFDQMMRGVITGLESLIQ